MVKGKRIREGEERRLVGCRDGRGGVGGSQTRRRKRRRRKRRRRRRRKRRRRRRRKRRRRSRRRRRRRRRESRRMRPPGRLGTLSLSRLPASSAQLTAAPAGGRLRRPEG